MSPELVAEEVTHLCTVAWARWSAHDQHHHLFWSFPAQAHRQCSFVNREVVSRLRTKLALESELAQPMASAKPLEDRKLQLPPIAARITDKSVTGGCAQLLSDLSVRLVKLSPPARARPFTRPLQGHTGRLFVNGDIDSGERGRLRTASAGGTRTFGGSVLDEQTPGRPWGRPSADVTNTTLH